MNKKSILTLTGIAALASSLFLFNSCVSIPKGAQAVTNFNADKYLGKWYEIARMDFRFEKNMDNTTAQYSKNDDGSIKVVNRGFKYTSNEWKEAVGKAKFVESADVARLKVSFFGPFYAGYNVVELDEDYKYALVIGNNPGYCWILARTKTIPEDIKIKYLETAKRIGVETEKLIWPKHDK